MTEYTSQNLTVLLHRWLDGDKEAGDQLMSVLYPDLRRLAANYLRQPGNTLQPTALVNELYLKLFSGEPLEWRDCAHFFALAALQLRRLVIDNARTRHAEKRGGDRVRVP